ncbi:MAG: chorismate synthase [Oligoflexia bacterium]|nr:chorismate synthase [Oligoflexia bacterium]
MNGNTFGEFFKVTTWGESHGPATGVVIDGCPAKIRLDESIFLEDFQLRQGGNSTLTTARKEKEEIEILSGVLNGQTTGTPISIVVRNTNIRSNDYENVNQKPRPGHADLGVFLKEGAYDHRGGGRLSARETLARTAAGVVAKEILKLKEIELFSWVRRAGPYELTEEDGALEKPIVERKNKRNQSELRTLANTQVESQTLGVLKKIREAGDSFGGELGLQIENLPPGLGEPVFDKFFALMAHGLSSLPACIGILQGLHDRSLLPGSAIRDPIGLDTKNKISPLANIHNGTLGGITTGHPILYRVLFHAPTSVQHPIESIDLETKQKEIISVSGRHDSFPLPRAVPMVEAMAAITLVNLLMRAKKF